MSRSSGVDLVSGEGLEHALRGADAVIDVSSTRELDADPARSFFASATQNLIEAERAAGVGHHVVLSIVGIDRVEGTGHYAGKRRQEEVAAAATGFSLLRATQFFDFPGQVVGWVGDGAQATLPPLLLQPVAVEDVAAALVEIAIGAPGTRAEIAGPQTEDFIDMARRTLAARGENLRLIPSWRGGLFGVEMAGEALLPSERARIGPTGFEHWLGAQGQIEA